MCNTFMFVVKKVTKDMCYNEIGLYTQSIDTMNVIAKANVIAQNEIGCTV